VPQASLLTSQAGYSAVFFARSDYDELERRRRAGSLEAVWRPSADVYGSSADTFLGTFPNHYGPPAGFNFEWGSDDPPIQVHGHPRSYCTQAGAA
jgi:alpha-mannosidase